jgi:ribosomal protein S12 methylthiotransferase accessory factor YcaO
MAESGVPETTMLALLGHVSRQMLERYSHIRLTAKRVAVEVLTLPQPTIVEMTHETAKRSPKSRSVN